MLSDPPVFRRGIVVEEKEACILRGFLLCIA